MTMEDKKKKRPTAEKRMLQNAKNRRRNKISIAKVKAATKELAIAENKDLATEEKNLAIYKAQSTIDKAKKKGALSSGKANRMKARIYKAKQ